MANGGWRMANGEWRMADCGSAFALRGYGVMKWLVKGGKVKCEKREGELIDAKKLWNA
jgi:hypothetical protein